MLQDAQLEKRLRSLVEQLAKGVGRSIPSPVRIGRPPRRHTGSSPTAGAVKNKTCLVRFRPIAGRGAAMETRGRLACEHNSQRHIGNHIGYCIT